MRRLKRITEYGFAGLFAAVLMVGGAQIAMAASTGNPNAAPPGGTQEAYAPAVNRTPPIAIPPKIAAVGQGTGQNTFYPTLTSNPCPDVTCGDTSCACELGTGSMVGVGFGRSTFSYEVNVSTGAGMIPSGSFAENYTTAGFVTITMPGRAGDQINLVIQGNTSDVFNNSEYSGFTGSYIVQGGTGVWAAATGAGNCSISLNYGNTGSGPTTITLNGALAKK